MSIRSTNAMALIHWLRKHPAGSDIDTITYDLFGGYYPHFHQAIAYLRDIYADADHALVVTNDNIYKLSSDPDEIRLYRMRRVQRAIKEMERTHSSVIVPWMNESDPSRLRNVDRQMVRAIEDMTDFAKDSL